MFSVQPCQYQVPLYSGSQLKLIVAVQEADFAPSIAPKPVNEPLKLTVMPLVKFQPHSLPLCVPSVNAPLNVQSAVK